jgi:hypothetical protein
MRSAMPVAVPQGPSAMTAVHHSAQPTPNAATCALRHSANRACHSMKVSTRSQLRKTASPRETRKAPESGCARTSDSSDSLGYYFTKLHRILTW